MVEKKLFPLDYKSELKRGAEVAEGCVHFYCYLLKIVSSKGTVDKSE